MEVKMKNVVVLCAACGIGKSTIKEFICENGLFRRTGYCPIKSYLKIYKKKFPKSVSKSIPLY